MATKHEGIVGRSDVYRVAPEYIKIQESWNPRTSFGDEKDEELKNSIVENGVLIPLRIKKNGDELFHLIDGERRLRAVQKAIEEGHEIQSVPCLLERNTINQIDALVTALLSNEGKPLSPSEEAEAYQRLKNWGLSAEKIAQKTGKSIPLIHKRLQLVDAAPEVKEALDNKEVSQAQALEIVKESQGDIQKQTQELETKKEERKEKKARGDSKKGKKKEKKSVDVQEVRDLLNEAVSDYESTDDEGYKQFCGGMIRVYSTILEEVDPIDLDY